MSWLIRIHNADVFLNGKQVLNAIDWTMKKKENWAVVGVNGAGKTSFMKLIFGELIPIDGGEVRWFGNEQHGPLSNARKRIGFVSEEQAFLVSFSTGRCSPISGRPGVGANGEWCRG